MSERRMKQRTRGLEDTHLSEVQDYLKEHADSILRSDRPFSKYMRAVIRKKGLKQRDVFLWADIPERYGYKLISEEKRTRQRDVILRICYAARFTTEETQKALRIYEMPQLYEKIPRDVVLLLCFQERPGSVNDVNAVLQKHGVIWQIKYCLLPQIKNNFLRYTEALQSVLFATISAHCFM